MTQEKSPGELLIDRRDLDFQLYQMLGLEALLQSPRYAGVGRDTVDSIIDTAYRLAQDKFAPSAGKLDANEPHFDGERVHVIPEVAEALRAYIDAGFMSLSFDHEDGGLQLPFTIATAVSMVFCAANQAINGYPFLTIAAAHLLATHGSAEQKRRFMQPMVEGRYFGTMCLSEPHAGSSLADIRTRAVPAADGSYRIKGTKMWISGGDHELSDNIVHLVLAKIPGGPAGVKGISLFIVPKHRIEADGTRGARNDVRLVGLNHKMGQRGLTNCLLNFGEHDDCVGYLVGEPHTGLALMFHMMNEARIGVGSGATSAGYTGYLNALQYARNRPQGRRPDCRDPSTPPVPIIEHADVRRMLLQQKAYVEGCLTLSLECAMLVDRQRVEEDPRVRREIDLLLEMLTPIAKTFPSEYCLEANKLAIQVLGGAGYTRDFPVERLYRDNRLNPIHEGTTGIQGLDLLGRKVRMHDGEGLRLLLSRIEAAIAEAAAVPRLREEAEALTRALDAFRRTTGELTAALAAGRVLPALANATLYLDAMGLLVLGWIWLRQALVAAALPESAFTRGKLRACRYFFRYDVPRIAPLCAMLSSFDDTCLNAADDEF
ncbi:acyl-CoA dehydrogenase [Solimonas variicoloris]|uniref:acyl-CoA dehydrogenase n=1 Tax=Solimonas variicoloris TaxID=254408 RepID=UPI000364F892|nr:acyl-CoA dehydrogenase [Solimonas variicoloris]